MLALAEEALKEFNPDIRVELFGQELNGESFGICKSDMLVTGHDPENIVFGNTLTQDAHKDRRFHYMLSNPPYGVDWKKYQEPIREEAATLGKDGRFGAGLPRISDGQLLFLQHMIAKMRTDEVGSRSIRPPTASEQLEELLGYHVTMGRPPKHYLSTWTVTDDWPDVVPVTEAEIDVFEQWFSDLFDELFGSGG